MSALSTIASTAERLFFEPERRSNEILLWKDTWASLIRLGLGVGIGHDHQSVTNCAVWPLWFVSILSMVPPLALLPILFIIFGLGELSKVVLIIIGITPFMARDLSQRVLEKPTE